MSRKFVVYLALAHKESREKLVQSMSKLGGYILHVDGTCEGDSPHLFCGMDGISEWVLDNIKIPSEKKELLVPFFRRIRDDYGDPLALVHDMGIGIMNAVAEVFPGIPDYICHFHFLRDVGKDLLLDDYQIIISRLRKHKVRTLLRQKARYLEKKIDLNSEALFDLEAVLKESGGQASVLKHIPSFATYVLIHWIFESPSGGYGFPFDRPHLEFYGRLRTVHGLLQKISGVYLRNKIKDNRPFIQLNKLLAEVLSDKKLSNAASSMTKKAKVFDKLRGVLRIAVPEGKKGLNDPGDETDMKTIEEELGTFKAWLECKPSRRATYIKMLNQIDKYWEKLFADPILVNTPEGSVHIAPQRTNNILERFFRGEKRRGRKRSGTVSLNKMLKAILADTPLVRNLEDQEYRKSILNGCDSLAERFSQIDDKLVREKLNHAEKTRSKMPLGMKKFIKQLDLPEKISKVFAGCSNFNANCHLPT